jgi:hypothetical protein
VKSATGKVESATSEIESAGIEVESAGFEVESAKTEVESVKSRASLPGAGCSLISLFCPSVRANMRAPGSYLVCIFLSLACHRGSQTAARGGGGEPTTGITGTAHISPTRPFCPPERSCKAPLPMSFEVRQGQRVVTTFTSDSAGRFTVHLPPGRYTVGPGPRVGIMLRRQIHEVTVGPKGLTSVQLEFDSGISGPR